MHRCHICSGVCWIPAGVNVGFNRQVQILSENSGFPLISPSSLCHWWSWSYLPFNRVWGTWGWRLRKGNTCPGVKPFLPQENFILEWFSFKMSPISDKAQHTWTSIVLHTCNSFPFLKKLMMFALMPKSHWPQGTLALGSLVLLFIRWTLRLLQ